MMKLHLPPELAEIHGTKVLNVLARYIGALESEFINKEIEAGTLKQIYHNILWEKHHVVSFQDELWVNDLLPFDEVHTFTPIDLSTEN